MLLRYTSSLSLGLVVTFALLLLMHGLVATDRGPQPTRPTIMSIQVARIPPPPPEIERIRLPEPIDAAAPSPERPDLVDRGRGTPIRIPTTNPVPSGPADVGFGTLTDGDLLLMVAVAPSYPMTGITQQLEGHVVVEYTVTRHGTVSGAIVVESSHALFEKPALEAIRKFKYRPRVVNGEPVDVPGQVQRIRFVLDGA